MAVSLSEKPPTLSVPLFVFESLFEKCILSAVLKFYFDVSFIGVYKETVVLLRFLYFLFDISLKLIISNAFKY